MVVRHFRDLEKCRFSASNFCFFRSIRFFCKFPDFQSPNSVYTWNLKLKSLLEAGKLESARKLFDEMPQRDVVSWNKMITGYWRTGRLHVSKKLFEVMPNKSIVSWNSMIAGCLENDGIDDAYGYFCAMPERNTASWDAMISGLIKYGRFKEAKNLFEAMPQRDVISYTTMLDGLMQIGDVELARQIFDSMPERNVVSWTAMISGYISNDCFHEARELYGQMPYKNIVTVTALITGYCKEGKVEEARKLFDTLCSRDVIGYNAMISGYAQNGCGDDALALYIRMHREALRPDQATSVSILSACSSLASPIVGRQSHASILKYGLDLKVPTANALIDMYSKCGDILASELAFEGIKAPELVSWNTIIAAFSRDGLHEKAFSFFNQMELEGFEPDGFTFLSLLGACCHSGMVDVSIQWFNCMMRDYNFVPWPEHYACLIDILGRAGQLEKAYKVIQEMPFEADKAAWGALLSGCCAYANLELGLVAADKVLQFDEKNSGAYVLLSNIYAATGKWREVTRMRDLMIEKGVNKQPAYSWMEVQNEVHCFLGGDTSHPKIQEVRSVVEGVNIQLNSVVFVA